MPDQSPSESLPPNETPSGGVGRTGSNQMPSTVAEEIQPPFPVQPNTPTVPASYGRYRVLQAHAQGGLGKVSLAQDTKLGRTVALKEIRPDRQPSPDALQRFVNEAAITGLLEHPGIVPVYSLDEDEQGKPYYAMRFIEGQSLQQALEAFHAKPQPASFRKLLSHFIAVCHAIAFAHSKRVIHRDLKPDNIMLGEYGETLVVDWGLAKRMPNEERRMLKEAPIKEDAPEAHSAFAILHSALTQTGAVMGTPAYMSPEQARGDVVGQGPATDVYALGGILYAILTGRAPYQGSAMEILAKLQQNVPPLSPLLVKAAIPKALAAVCQRAMAADKNDRYLSAHDLAAEVERWLADEPVRAFAEPWTLRLRRWRKRHRTLVTSAVGILAVAVPLLVVGLAMVEDARQQESSAKLAERGAKEQERQAKESALAARDRERTAKLTARRAVATLFSERQLEVLEKQDRLTQEQRQQLQILAEFYRDCAQEAAVTESEFRKQAADYFQLAKVLARLGQVGEAITAYGYAAEIGQRLVAAHPREEEYQAGLARVYSNLGTLHFRQRQHAAAEAHFHLALRLQQLLYTQAMLLNEPERHEYQHELGITCNNLAEVYLSTGRHLMAEEIYQKARQIFDHLTKRQPTELQYVAALANVWNNLGALQITLGRAAEAKASQQQALILYEKLRTAQPGLIEYQLGMAGARFSLGYVRRLQGQLTEAEADYRVALALYTQVAAAYPSNADYQARLARTLRGLGNVCRSSQKLHEAENHFTRSREILAQLAAAHPQDTDAHADLAGAWNNLGVVQRQLGRVAEAEASYRQALPVLEKLLVSHPDMTTYRVDLAAVYANLGDLPVDRGEPATALPWYDKAIHLLQPALAREPQHSSLREMLRNSHRSRAVALSRLNRHVEAVHDFHHALALDDGSQRAWIEQRVATVLTAALDQGKRQARLGLHRHAARKVAHLSQLRDMPTVAWTELARVLASCSTARGSWFLAEPTAAERERYAAQAVKLLQRGRLPGFFSTLLQAERWLQEAELLPLHDRADFRALVRQVKTARR